MKWLGQVVALDAQATAVMGLLEALEDSNTDIYRQTDTSLLMMMSSFITLLTDHVMSNHQHKLSMIREKERIYLTSVS